MTTYTWKVSQLERESSDGYVFTAHWNVNATETVEDKTYSAGAYGSIGLERPEEDLIAFEELTEELVVSWVLDKLGEEQVVNIVMEWYTNGMYPDILQNKEGEDLEEICEIILKQKK